MKIVNLIMLLEILTTMFCSNLTTSDTLLTATKNEKQLTATKMKNNPTLSTLVYLSSTQSISKVSKKNSYSKHPGIAMFDV